MNERDRTVMEKNRIDVIPFQTADVSTPSAYEMFAQEDLKNRILLINDHIDEMVVDEQVMCILRWNAEDKDLPVDKRKTITIYINSEGGSEFDGQALIDVIRASRTKIRTVCLGMAASMAYLIYIAGHERISFKNSCFLMHEGELALGGATSKTKDTMKFFDDMEERTKNYILDVTKIDNELYEKVYKKEFWMYSQQAKELGIVDKIIGEDVDIDVLF